MHLRTQTLIKPPYRGQNAKSLFSRRAFYSIIVKTLLCTGAIQADSGIYITQGNLSSCLTHLIFMGFVRDIHIERGQIHSGGPRISRSEPHVFVPFIQHPFPSRKGTCARLRAPHSGLFNLSLVVVGFHHGRLQQVIKE